jgi:hypothetical protein
VALVALTACGKSTPKDDSADRTFPTTSSSSKLSLNTGDAPWPAPADAKDRATAAGLISLGQEQLAFHRHAHLDILVNGQAEPVPGGLGIDQQAQTISTLHTHSTDGVIHMEAGEPTVFTLGQLFTEWGVRLTATCVGGYCTPGTPIAYYVDGNEVAPMAAPALELDDLQEIAIVIGTPPATVPNKFPGT